MKHPSKVTMDSLKAIVSSQQQNEFESETKPHTETSSQAADWVWQQMAEIYGEQWVREHGEKPSLALKLLSEVL